jgi:ubiquinone/menaquinone biosynthesis C-methylase UbiE
MKKPTLFRSRHGSEYDEEFMHVMSSVYERQTRHTKMRQDNVVLLVEPKPGDRVLDLGCATGAMAHFLSTFGCEVVGSDSSEVGIREARRLHPEIRFELADAAQLPFPDESFDKIVAADLTEHLTDETIAAMYDECRRVLVPGGTLSIHTPNPKHAIERLKDKGVLIEQNPSHIGLRTSPELRRGLEAAGFEIDVDVKRRSFIPGFRTLELVGAPLTELLRYRICLRARKPLEETRARQDESVPAGERPERD